MRWRMRGVCKGEQCKINRAFLNIYILQQNLVDNLEVIGSWWEGRGIRKREKKKKKKKKKIILTSFLSSPLSFFFPLQELTLRYFPHFIALSQQNRLKLRNPEFLAVAKQVIDLNAALLNDLCVLWETWPIVRGLEIY